MPKVKKQKAHLRRARQQLSDKRQKSPETDPVELEQPEDQPSTSGVAPEVEEIEGSSQSDSDFDPEDALLKDPDAMIEEFVADWVATLPRDDLYALSLLLFHILQQEFLQLVYPASKIIGKVLNRSYKTIQKWRVDFLNNKGELPDFLRGKYERMQAIANNEDLTEQARLYVRENSFKKGAPNMTARSFCSWVNDELLPNSTLEPGAPRKISVEVARRWLLSMGFKVSRITKGIYVDGHERADVIEARGEFLKTMTTLGFLNENNAPNEEVGQLLPKVTIPPDEKETIFWFHDESSYNANDDQSTMWKDQTMQVMRPKGRGAGLMVSDFIEERDGYLAIPDALYETVKQHDPSIPQSARVIFEYGKTRDGYWNNQLFMEQMEVAVRVAEAKYPPRAFNHVWIFDHSCGHTAFAPDALVASRLNRKPGGKQPAMRDTVWAGKPQKLVLEDGTPKGAAMILEERGIRTSSLKLEQLIVILSQHDDFKNEKNSLETMLSGKGHTAVFLPKFHCELNGIERVWGHSKRITRAYCNYSIASLRETVPWSLNSIPVETITNYIQKSRVYMFAYLGGHTPGSEMETMVKKFSKEYKSHRRVGDND